MNFFKNIFSKLKNLFSDPAKRKKIEEGVRFVTDLADYVLPVVATVAKLTPTPVDDFIVDALKAINKRAEDILDEPDDVKRAGMFLGLASEALRARLAKAVDESGDGIQIGNKWLKNAADVVAIAKHVLDTAAQGAFFIYKTTQN